MDSTRVIRPIVNCVIHFNFIYLETVLLMRHGPPALLKLQERKASMPGHYHAVQASVEQQGFPDVDLGIGGIELMLFGPVAQLLRGRGCEAINGGQTRITRTLGPLHENKTMEYASIFAAEQAVLWPPTVDEVEYGTARLAPDEHFDNVDIITLNPIDMDRAVYIDSNRRSPDYTVHRLYDYNTFVRPWLLATEQQHIPGQVRQFAKRPATQEPFRMRNVKRLRTENIPLMTRLKAKKRLNNKNS